MKVILTENVKTLGSVGEIVNVSEGHARNFLIPTRKAILADGSNQKQMSDYQKRLAKKVEEEKKAASDLAQKVNGLSVSLVKKVGGNGRLFGTVTSSDLSKELAKQGLEIEKRLIHILEPIKTLGEFNVQAKLFKDVEASFKVKVEMDEKQAQEFKAKQAAAEARAAKKSKSEPKSEDQAQEDQSEQEA